MSARHVDQVQLATDHTVTRQLFEDYYDLQSITVDRDEQFEALVRSSWIALVRQKAAARKKRG